MFIYTIDDIIGWGLFALLLVVAIILIIVAAVGELGRKIGERIRNNRMKGGNDA